MTGMKLENNQIQALAFMIMLAITCVIWDLGRASAHKAAAMLPNIPIGAPAQLPSGSGPLPMPASTQQYGLIQTGVVGITPLNGNGAFGQAAAMPVFQLVRLDIPNPHLAAANAGGASAMPVAPEAATPIETQIPSGVSVMPSRDAAQAGTVCAINQVQVLTPTADACLLAGGRVTQLPAQ